ncbi:CRISPR-associated helicase Cas3' [Acidiphilium acidophilum]|uniref:CRISPR-associated helicase Cas3' n=1 Tax=Acidiphilium acidophilum TaxID=76588 RepID=UPI002E8E6D91|nr:CRISPR-associated helicase Cas3' [Acidiphilium acidophilum]
MDHLASKPSDHLRFWGKASYGYEGDGAVPNWHPAACHMLDVAAVALVWLDHMQPLIPGLPNATCYHSSIAMLIALHDIGKFSRPFQGKRKERWPSVLGPYVKPAATPFHDSAGFTMLADLLYPSLDALLPGWDIGDTCIVLRAVCGHHGSPPETAVNMREAVCRPCRAAATALIDDLYRLFQPAGLPAMTEADTIAFGWWLAGLTVLADWIGSNETWFEFAPDCASLDDYWLIARERAAQAVEQAGILPISAQADFSIAALLPEKAVATPMQDCAASLDLGAATSPVLVIIEDQTGSGKTEAALLLAQRIMTEKSARGLFIALPTMATANALHERLGKTYTKLFATGGAAPSLVLAHGRRLLNDRFQEAMRAHAERQVATPATGSDADETATAQCAGWIAEDRRRAFLADCGVGTIDQALHAVLPTRHAPLRLFGLRDRVLIIDEAHAYDTYMKKELFRLIEFQARLGGSTIILSATLPAAKRQEFLTVFAKAAGGGKTIIHRSDYPLVTTATAQAMVETPCEPRKMLARRIEVERLETAEAAVDHISAAPRDAAIAWIRNTVDDAVAAKAMLAARGIAATLFHARFAMGDRLATEAKVQDWFGKDSTGAARAHIVIGTQVMEQSLDIDVDLMITDLAPVDLLLQRAGRLWRHQRSHPSVDTPRLLILSPEPVAEPAADWLRDMRGTEAVYRDPALLWRSARTIFASDVLHLPEHVRGLVEAAYAEDAPVPEGLRRKSDQALSKDMVAAATAGMNLLEWRKAYCRDNGPWESDIRTPTRLSDPSLTIRLARWEDAALRPWYSDQSTRKAWALSEIALPMRRVNTVPKPSGAIGEALAALYRSWPRMEQDMPVLILRQIKSEWLGVARDKNDRDIQLIYAPDHGMMYQTP